MAKQQPLRNGRETPRAQTVWEPRDLHQVIPRNAGVAKPHRATLIAGLLPLILALSIASWYFTGSVTPSLVPFGVTVALIPTRLLVPLALLALSLTRALAASQEVLETRDSTVTLGVVTCELILLAWMLRTRPQNLLRASFWTTSDVALGVFLATLSATTVYHGFSFTPIAHLGVLGLVMLFLRAGAAFSWAAFGYALLLSMIFATVLSFEGVTTRLMGGDPAQLGFTSIACFLLFKSRSPLWASTVQFSSIAVLVMTQTRSAYVAGLFALVAILIPQISLIQGVLLAGGFLAIGIASTGWITTALGLNEDSIELRAQSIRGGLEVLKDNTLLGVGWGGQQSGDAVWLAGLSNTIENQSVYNLFLGVATAGGIVASIAFIAFIFSTLRDLSTRNSRVMVLILAFCVMGMVEFTLYPGSPTSLIFFVSIGAALARSASATASHE
jgi:hypothetical protein